MAISARYYTAPGHPRSAPAIEIHMTNIERRGYGSITSEAAVGMIAGFGGLGYELAIDAVAQLLKGTP